MTQDKHIIAKYIDDSRENIIAKYSEGMNIIDIAELYNVAYSTIYFRLLKWGVKIRKHGGARLRRGRPVRQKRVFSLELLVKMKKNSRINDEQINYVEFEGVTEDQKLVRNILCRPIIG